MRAWLRKWWPYCKAVLAVAIIGSVGWQFASILRSPELWREPLQPQPVFLILSAVLYLVGLSFSGGFWYLLLRQVGESLTLIASYRAYFIGHLGKYVPGKAWAVILRTSLVHAVGVRTGVAAMTATYETLTTMAAGALVAFILFILVATEDSALGWKACGLLALAGIPILPGIFNPLVRRLSAPFLEDQAVPLPQLRNTTLPMGLAMVACGWMILGASLWAMVQAVRPEPELWCWITWQRYTAYIALAYVAGFLTLPAPGGLGVRELILQQLLAPELGPRAVVAVLLLRLLWTVAELFIAGVLYCWPIVDKPSSSL
jgi:uncharacterized membrane protein YbhN (UPF0104 family)